MARGIPTRTHSGKPKINREVTHATSPATHKPSSVSKDSSTSAHNNSAPTNTYKANNPPSKYDEAFEVYYNTIQGLVSRLSAPLAFPSMPLLSRFFASETRPSKSSKFASTLPDIRKLISPGALEAVNERKHGDPTEESFYIVSMPDAEPMTYKDAVARGKVERKPEDGTSEDEPASAPRGRHRTSKAGRRSSQEPTNSRSSSKFPQKTTEELRLENHMLQELAENLAKRLREVNANQAPDQPTSAAEQIPRPSPYIDTSTALDHLSKHATSTSADFSLGLQQKSGELPDHTKQPHTIDDGAKSPQTQDLERRLQQTEEKLSRALRENTKMKSRWDDLLKGARSRRNDAHVSDNNASRKDSS